MTLDASDRGAVAELLEAYEFFLEEWRKMAGRVVGYEPTRGAEFNAADRNAAWSWFLEHRTPTSRARPPEAAGRT
jgi:hypothetical protein